MNANFNLTPQLNTSQRLLQAGILCGCFGPYVGYLSFSLILFSVLLSRLDFKRVFSFLLVFFVFSISAAYSILSLFDFNVLSFFVALITLLILFFVKNNELVLLSERVISVVALTVPIAFFIAMTQSLGIYPLEFRGNEVLGIMRFTFLFAEPSHYSIVLSLCALIAVIKPTPLVIKILLLCGLLLTWSLSGFCIFAFGYVGYKFYSRGILKSFFLALVLLFVMMCLWFYWLENSNFWLASKVQSVIQLFSGESVGASSAMLRYNSLIIGPYFIYENIAMGNLWNSILGLGFGNLSSWVAYYYESNFSISEITDANNIMSNVLISNGLVGLVCYFFAYSYFTGLDSIKVFLSGMMLLVLSLFSGYAFGPFAIITLLLTRIYILTVIENGARKIH
ncbi:hypothetical protein QQF21_10555 [Lelliottia sp. V89_10]|uniref:hypothetical protein n=1 Tax=Lelliottia wanjuensis TaxID=3050585 RepID=UPI00249DCBA4|nr:MULTISPECIES: hypothetical protein [unclassified Lelliottia]MDI3361452.1 hypothetical protein [Lelliottia sp. V89_13]MDK9549347.1 hypothetical protein [Lelliottia sp. V89_5]MDK9596048.1 hypothetical protein [Lelliottia sp. V89_10]